MKNRKLLPILQVEGLQGPLENQMVLQQLNHPSQFQLFPLAEAHCNLAQLHLPGSRLGGHMAAQVCKEENPKRSDKDLL